MDSVQVDGMTTLHLIRTAWPIVTALCGAIFGLAGVYFMARQTKEDLKDFKTGQYVIDRGALLTAIEKVQANQEKVITEVKENQEKVEKKLEEKLDRMEDRYTVQQAKLFGELNAINISLARLEGRLQSSGSGQNKTPEIN